MDKQHAGYGSRQRWGIRAGSALAALSLSLGALGLVSGATAQAQPAAPRDTGCADVGMAPSAEWDKLTAAGYTAASSASRDMGMGRLRIGVDWKDIESSPGQLDWRALDARMAIAQAQGLEPLMLIQTVPDWLTLPTSTGVSPQAQAVAEQFGSFAGKVAQRYGAQADAYEIWNEPNLDRFWSALGPDPAQYALMLKESYGKIHAADPVATVIAAGLAPAPDKLPATLSPMTFLSQLYDAGLAGFADAVAVHPYSYPEAPSGQSDWNTFKTLEQIHALMEARGDGAKQIWLTEYGAPTGGLGGTAVSQAQQAAFMVEAVQLARQRDWLGPIFLYTLADGGASTLSVEHHFGFYGTSGAPKPAVAAMRALLADCASVADPGTVTLEYGSIVADQPGGGGNSGGSASGLGSLFGS